MKLPDYNPQFIYPEIPADLFNKYLDDLDSAVLNAEDDLSRYYYERKKNELKLMLLSLLKRGTEEFSDSTLELFQCKFPEKYLQEAEEDAKLPGDFGPKEGLNIEETVGEMEKYLAKLGLKAWKVEPSQKSDFYFRVKSLQKKILVGKEINWDFCDLDNTCAHEIDGHVLRAVNAAKQPNPLLRKAFPFYIKTEEGLACYLGDYFSTNAEISRKHHALKYLAGQLAQKESFSECYKYFMDNGFTSELAFRRTFRLKRGLEDTTMPGCNANEAVYYEGMLEVRDYLRSGGDIKKLFSAKAGLEDMEYIPVAGNLILPFRIANKPIL
jgi:hypothetical protein